MNHEPFPNHIKFDDITKGILVSHSMYQKLLVSAELPKIYPIHAKFLLVYAIYPKLTRITCYPVYDTQIFKLRIQLTNASHDVLANITNLFSKNELIHTTGLSKEKELCKVENYYKLNQNWDSLQKLVELLNNENYIHQSQIELIPFQEDILS